jgi:hypothetical protein
VDDEDGKIFEHRIWLAEIESLKLPVREEHLVDGEPGSVYEYEYISINKDIDDSMFELGSPENVIIHEAEGIPKLVKNEAEAEKYVKFNVAMAQYIPAGFKLNEIFIIPPEKTPSVLISYISDIDMIYLKQKNIKRNQLSIEESDRIVESGGKRFAVRDLFDNSINIRWIRNGIEFELSGPYDLRSEMSKVIHSLTGIWVPLEE